MSKGEQVAACLWVILGSWTKRIGKGKLRTRKHTLSLKRKRIGKGKVGTEKHTLSQLKGAHIDWRRV